MSDYFLGQYSAGPFSGYEGLTQNQLGSLWSVPTSGVLHRLRAWIRTPSGYPADSCKIVAWDAATNAVVAQTDYFAVQTNDAMVAFEAEALANATVTASQQLIIGIYWIATGTHTVLNSLYAGSLRYKAAGNGGPVSMAGYSTDGDYQVAAGAYVSPFVTPNKPTTESYGVVTSLTPTVRLNVTTPDSAALTAVDFVVTGISPAHGPVTVHATGGPWASGSWVSQVLNLAALGWTPAAGDTLSYHGVASNSGGTATGDESTTLTINSTSSPTIDSPAAGPVIAQAYLAAGKVGATVAWTFTDPQGEAQSAYQVKFYADAAGPSRGAALAGADTGKVASVSARTASVIPTAGLTNRAYFWVGVQVWDVHDATSGEVYVRTRMAWGRFDGRINLLATPTVWQAPAVSATTPANTAVVLEYGSTAGATYPPASWGPFSGVALAQYLHFRAWLFGWASASPTTPTLDAIAITYTSSANVAPDNWDIATYTAGQGSLDSSTSKYGDRSIKIACTGANALKYAFQTLQVKPGQDYILSADILVSKASGTIEAYVDLFDGANSLVKTAKLTASSSDFERKVSTVYHNTSATSLTLRLCVLDGTGASGSAVWFDAIACHPGAVAVSYSPSSGGRAAAFDAGGATIDGSKGAILRYRGSSGGQYDVVEGGVHGLKVGAGEFTGIGATLPTPATAGDLFFLTTAGEMCQYDGTHWLGEKRTLNLKHASVVAAADLRYAVGNAAQVFEAPLPAGDVAITELDFQIYDTSTGFGYHDLALYSVTGSTQSAALAYGSTTGGARNTWVKVPITGTLPLIISGANVIRLDIFGYNTPGAAYFEPGATYRRIYT